MATIHSVGSSEHFSGLTPSARSLELIMVVLVPGRNSGTV